MQATKSNNMQPEPMCNLTAIQRDMLLVINDTDDAYGMTVKNELKTHYDKFSDGQLYHNLERLEKQGLIERDYPEDNARRKILKLTSQATRTIKRDLLWRENRIGGF